ncbi:MAG: hypothetical protein PHI29_13075 [Gallionella sp.]|nr:hypothetical protein [Gallionella sp.]
MRTLIALCVFCILQSAYADELHIAEAKPVSEFWLNGGFISHHFQTDKGLNNQNWGLGGEYRYSTTSSVTVGQFYNSDRQTSHYAGWYWQPLAIDSFRFGAVMGGFDGYPRMRNGGWFLAAIPVISYDYQRVGINLAIVPTIRDRLYGAVSLQLKVRLY